MKAFRILLCVLLPPLAVFMHVGFRLPFFLTSALTVLGFVPGAVHALYVVLTQPSPYHYV
jgi:uncharacterized membrane protein YqaE (UPF0057 family)